MESHQLFFSVLSVFFSDKTFCDGKSLREKTGWNSFSPKGIIDHRVTAKLTR
jgi:hypothetical protein